MERRCYWDYSEWSRVQHNLRDKEINLGGQTRHWQRSGTRCLYAALCVAASICLCDGAGVEEVARVSMEEQRKLIGNKYLECEIFILKNPPLSTNNTHCPPVWDRLMCWPETPAGSVAVQPCPNYVDKFRINQNASRTCKADGRWFVNPATNQTWTDFTRCFEDQTTAIPLLIRSHMGRIRLMYTINYGISLGSLVLAVLIMLCFKRLHCPRNTIHLNLFGSFILRASFSFMKENLLVEGLGFPSDVIETPDGVVFKQNSSHWECKLFFTVFYYVLGANYMWILVEALYLNLLITVAVFSERSGIKYYITFGWTLPLTFVIPWVIVRATCENVLCWNTHPTEGYFWIMKGPIVASIVINFFIFLNIIRVLFTKLTAVNSPEAKKFRYRKLAKSTLVLIPLFGVHYIVFLFLPKDVDERTELVKLYFEMFFNSIQGFFVALLFCFFNGEVQSEIRKTWLRFRLTHQRNFSRESCRSRTAGGSSYTTYMSRARESMSSIHQGQNGRAKTDDRSCRYSSVVDETPLSPMVAFAEQQPLTNGKGVHVTNLEIEPITSNGSCNNIAADNHDGSGNDLIRDEQRVY